MSKFSALRGNRVQKQVNIAECTENVGIFGNISAKVEIFGAASRLGNLTAIFSS